MKTSQLFTLGILILCLGNLSAQPLDTYKSEVGLSVGTIFYMGDLTEGSPVKSESSLAFSAFYAYAFDNGFMAEIAYTSGSISANDSNNGKESGKQLRNLHFKSKISEISLKIKYDLFKPFNVKALKNQRAYLYVGIANFSHNPKAYYNDEWHELQPLGTEGQGLAQYPERKKYSLNNWSIPFGIGLSSHFSNRFNLSLSFGLNKTFTDYLDDVSLPYTDNAIIVAESGILAGALADRYIDEEGNLSPQRVWSNRGDPTKKDWYGSFLISLSYSFQSDYYYYD